MSRAESSWSFEDSSLGRSFLWSLAITVLPVASGFVVSWLIARWAGAEILGTVSWVMSYATAVLIVAKFGLDLAASRLASEYGVSSPGTLRTLFVSALGFRLLLTVVVGALSVAFAPWIATRFDDLSLTNPIRVGGLIVLCASIYEFDENFLIGLNRLAVVYKIRTLHLLSRVSVTLLLVLLGLGAAPILGGYCFAWIVAIIVYTVLLRRSLPPRTAADIPVDSRRMMSLAATLALSAASVTIYSHMDRLMLGYFTTMGEVGQYAIARNVAEVALFPVFAIVMVLRPALAARFPAGKVGESAQILENSLRFSWVFGVLFSAILVAFGRDLVVLVFTDSFLPAGELMVFFVGVILLRSAGALAVPALIAADRTRVYAYLTMASAGLNFALNLVLIPRFGPRGAVVATIVSYGFLSLLGLAEVLSKYRIRVTVAGVWVALRTILAGVLASGVFVLFGTGFSVVSASVVLGAVLLSILYFVLIYAFRVTSFTRVSDLFTNLRKQKG